MLQCGIERVDTAPPFRLIRTSPTGKSGTARRIGPYRGRVGLPGRTLISPEGEMPKAKPMKCSSFSSRSHLAHGEKWDRPADRSLPG